MGTNATRTETALHHGLMESVNGIAVNGMQNYVEYPCGASAMRTFRKKKFMNNVNKHNPHNASLKTI